MKKKFLVVDNSVMVKWINAQDEDHLEQANQILIDVEADKAKLLAPELAKYEIGNALLYKGLDLPAAKASLGTIYSLPITFLPMTDQQADETLEIAQEKKITY